MANTYTQIYLHIIYWIRGEKIDASFEDELYAYICGIIKNKGHKPLAIGGTSDHIHILVGVNPVQAISDLVKDIKTNSTRFTKNKFLNKNFRWQEGFGGFSYSRSQISRVINYIHNQKKHHARKTFKEEYIEILKKFMVEYDEKFII